RLLAPHVAPLLSRLESILGQEGQRFDEIAQRIHLARIGHRFKDAEHFSELSRALLQRRQVRITHYSRERDEHTARTVSPQRLTFYRNNWYLEAWCHTVRRLYSVQTAPPPAHQSRFRAPRAVS
ncbi:MAG TPA: hypothetical protein DCL53_11385, partial [Thauera sp.]|nr:hypothetical protein [Thauera sp.]